MDIGQTIEQVGRCLHAWRIKRGMTLQQVAERSGIGIGVLTRAETGFRDMRIRQLVPVARALGIDPRKLLERPPRFREPAISRGGRPRTPSKPAGARAS